MINRVIRAHLLRQSDHPEVPEGYKQNKAEEIKERIELESLPHRDFSIKCPDTPSIIFLKGKDYRTSVKPWWFQHKGNHKRIKEIIVKRGAPSDKLPEHLERFRKKPLIEYQFLVVIKLDNGEELTTRFTNKESLDDFIYQEAFKGILKHFVT